MEKKARFFRNVVANVVIVAVLAVTAAFAVREVSTTVSTDPISRGNSSETVSVMVKMYRGTEYLDELLRIFDENGVKTTFLIGGSWAAGASKALQKIQKAGHELGNHGFFERDYKMLAYERSREEIEVTHKLVEGLTGIEMRLFAPPGGSYAQNTLDAAKSLGYRTVLWTKDAGGYLERDPDAVYARATVNLKGGDLILLEPSAAAVSALGRILAAVRYTGLRAAPLGEVIGLTV
jgi:peptidoglycan/xylan/chitin deacetylase (PgdA/CDA1 family)